MIRFKIFLVTTFLIIAPFYGLFGQISIVHAKKNTAERSINGKKLPDVWTISPELRSDVWEVIVQKGQKVNCVFKTDIDSVCLHLKEGQVFDFVVVIDGRDSAHTRITGVREPVVFSNKYKRLNNGKTSVEVPEFSELVNIVIALTNFGESDSDLVYHDSKYYSAVLQHFGNYKTDSLILEIDTILKKEWWKYFYLKMDAYAYEFKGNKIVGSKTYDRLNSDGITNTCFPLVSQLQQFAVKTKFIEFYDAHKAFYQNQISFFTDSLRVQEMQVWLNKNFYPTVYDGYKIIFSPLAGGSQSANWYMQNQYSEAHMYINFPYISNLNSSSMANIITRGTSLFTELNHAYINPEASKYLDSLDFITAFADLKFWETDSSSAQFGYPNAYACFNEYMNWALVSLYCIDHVADSLERDMIISSLENNMVANRGFKRFNEFNQALISIYETREDGVIIKDIYPEIINWCRKYYEDNM